MIEYTSPMEKWPGSFELPGHDDVDGTHWDVWRDAFNLNSEESLNRMYAYAGAIFISKVGKWHFDAPTLAEFQKWQTDKKTERVRFVSWVGKHVAEYINELIDPKG